MEITIDYIKDCIKESLDAKNIDCENKTTRGINAEYALGKYFAFMDILKNIDLDAFCDVHGQYRNRVEELMQVVETLYH